MGWSGQHASLGRAQPTGEMGTFSWEKRNSITAREHFCNKVLGWFLSARDDTSTSIRTRHSLEIGKSLKATHSTPPPQKKGANAVTWSGICAMFTTI